MPELVPGRLAAFGRTPNPATAVVRFDHWLERLPAGVQLLSLFYANPKLLDIVAEIMGGVPRLAEQLARRPSLLDGVLGAEFFDPLPARPTLATELGRFLDGARDTEDLLDLARRWAHDKRFQIGAQILRGLLDGASAGAAFADVAESVIAELLPRTAAGHAAVHGTVPGGEMTGLGLGKLGRPAMTRHS